MAPRTESDGSGAESPRLQKYLADLGFGSRRQLEGWIKNGRISVNGVRAELGQRVARGDVVRVDGERIYPARGRQQNLRVLRYHKPVGEVCSRGGDETFTTVFEHLPVLGRGRWINVGRLDVNTSGLLLFTNNGELAHKLMHPSSEIDREYAVRVRGEVGPAVLKRLRAGVQLDDGLARFTSVSARGGEGANHWYHVELREGRSREVRRLWESQSVQVSRLIRVRYGPIVLGRKIRAGRWEEATAEEVGALLKQVNMQAPRKTKAVRARSVPRTARTRTSRATSRR